MKYIVTVTLKSPSSDPVHLVWYKGSSHTKAIAAMVSATTQDVADSEMPESIRTQMLSVTMTFEEEEALPSDYCDQSGAAPGEDNSTHHMMCLYCGKTEKQIREEKQS